LHDNTCHHKIYLTERYTNNACSLVHHQALMQGMSLLVPASFVTTLVTALINRAHTKYLRHTQNPSKSRDTRLHNTSPISPQAVYQCHHSSATDICVPLPGVSRLASVEQKVACEKHRRLQVQEEYTALDMVPEPTPGTNSRAIRYNTLDAHQHEYQRGTIARPRLMQKKDTS
jgi:hypothetical protein